MEHRNIPDGELHEPKGAANALSGTFYKSDGAGSGSWGKLSDSNVEGLGPNSPAGLRLVTDGNGGFAAEAIPGSAFGTMNLTNNAASIAVTAASNSNLQNNSDYQELSLALNFDSVEGMGTGSNYLEVEQSGLYLIDYWSNVRASQNNTKFALKFVINDTTFVPRGPRTNLITQDVAHNQSANGIHNFSSGDRVKLYVACDKSVNLTITDMTFQMVFLRALP
jgi:hypothetical protein